MRTRPFDFGPAGLRSGGTVEDWLSEVANFPISTDVQQAHLRALAEQLDAHRKRQQAAYPDLTLTGMYNALDKLRSGELLTAKEQVIREHDLISVLRQLHDEIDAAVLDAYGRSDLLPLLRVAHGNDAPADGAGRDEAKRAFEPQPWPKDAVTHVCAAAQSRPARCRCRWTNRPSASAHADRGKRLPQLLDMPVALGRAHEQDGRYSSH